MKKFEITVLAQISKAIEVEAKDYEAAIEKVRKMQEDGDLDETHGWVTVTAAGTQTENWTEIAQYDRH